MTEAITGDTGQWRSRIESLRADLQAMVAALDRLQYEATLALSGGREALRAGDAELLEGELHLDGRCLRLTGTKCILVRALLARAGRPVSRRQLACDLYGEHATEFQHRTISTHVCRLRKVLGAACCRLQTVRGLGYCWALDSTGAGDVA